MRQLKIWVIAPKHEGCGFRWRSLLFSLTLLSGFLLLYTGHLLRCFFPVGDWNKHQAVWYLAHGDCSCVHGDESNGRTDPMDIDGRQDLNITGNKQNKQQTSKSSKHTNILPTFTPAQDCLWCGKQNSYALPFFKQHVPCWTEEREVSSGSNGQWTNDWIRTQTFIAISMPVNGHCTITYKAPGGQMVVVGFEIWKS